MVGNQSDRAGRCHRTLCTHAVRTALGKETRAMTIQDKNGAVMPDEQVKKVHGYVPVTREEFDIVAKQVADIHEVVSALAAALNNPMLKSMLPPQIRAMFGG